jgi:ElaA protein
MNIKLRAFKSLSNDELYDVLKLRSAVFVVEQNCAYQDLDDKDKKGLHVLGYVGEDLAAYARLLPQGVSYKEASVGRVVVNPRFRGKNLGKELMNASVNYCVEEFRANEIVISAQLYLEKFYSDLGFVKESDTYLEDDIPHIKMRFRKPEH